MTNLIPSLPPDGNDSATRHAATGLEADEPRSRTASDDSAVSGCAWHAFASVVIGGPRGPASHQSGGATPQTGTQEDFK